MIRVEHLYKTYLSNGREIPALIDINLDIHAGEIFGIIGRSGAGKSSLIRTFNLLERPSQGRIYIEEQEITQLQSQALRGLRQRIGMVFQHFNLFQAKTVAENIAWPLKIAGNYTAAQRQERVAELLDLVGLVQHQHHYPGQLSGGQKQRVGIARALANYPHLLLCDEATSALDPETTQSILQLLQDINCQLGLTIVLITHEMQVIRTLCDRVAVLEAGQIIESGTVADVFLHPQHALTQSLVAHSHIFDVSAFNDRALSSAIAGKLVRLTFTGNITYEPVLHHIAASCAAQISILQGTIARIKATPYGQLLITIKGTSQDIAQVFSILDQQHIHHEVLQ